MKERMQEVSDVDSVMDEKVIVRKLMKMKGYNQTLIAENAGFKRQSNVSEMFRSRNLRVDNLIRILEAMDCELVIRSKTAVPREDDPTRTYKPEFVVELNH